MAARLTTKFALLPIIGIFVRVTGILLTQKSWRTFVSMGMLVKFEYRVDCCRFLDAASGFCWSSVFSPEMSKCSSHNFKEMVAVCLVKDQSKRPTAEKLLKHSFFKHAKPLEFSVKNLFADLPSLWDRVKAVQLKDAA